MKSTSWGMLGRAQLSCAAREPKVTVVRQLPEVRNLMQRSPQRYLLCPATSRLHRLPGASFHLALVPSMLQSGWLWSCSFMQAFPDAFKTEEPFPHFSPRETLAYAHACGTPAQEK